MPVITFGGVCELLMRTRSGSMLNCEDLGGEMFDRERACCGRIGGSGVDGNRGETSSSKEKVDW